MHDQVKTASFPLHSGKGREVLPYDNWRHCSGRTSHHYWTKGITNVMEKCKWTLFGKFYEIFNMGNRKKVN